ncbi:MAG: type VI secretion system protein ImpG [Halieaceae bacterium]|jgi:type VI secretion system protein ImpG
MSEGLLDYYNRELAWFRNALGEFSEAYPQAGGNLRISEDLVEDPHVSRLIESVALLNARVQSRLDDDFPRVIQAILDNLYPYYLAPKPSMFVAQLEPVAGIDSIQQVKSGTVFETESAGGVHCRFRSCYDSVISPLEITQASFASKPFSTPGSDLASGANAVLELKFSSSSADFSVGESGMDEIVLNLRPGTAAWRLYDLLYAHCVSIVIATSDLDPSPTMLSPKHLKAMGFQSEESILPDLGDSASDYQQLLEYFSYPEKFLFFRLAGLQSALAKAGSEFSLYIYLSETDSTLEKSLGKDSFALHAMPVVNLFPLRADPMRVGMHTKEYMVTPDIRALGDSEVYAITNVQIIADGTNEKREVHPYSSFQHARENDALFWSGHRRTSMTQAGGRRGVTDYHLTLSQLNGAGPEDVRSTLQITGMFSNANLPNNLQFGGGSPRLQPEEPLNGVQSARALTPPTPVRRLELDDGLLWRLLSHLNLNYLSLVGAKDPAAQLREMLRLYDMGDTPVTRALVASIDSVKTRVASLPISVEGRPVVCRGIELEVTLDSSIFESGSALLMGQVLQQFFAMYVSLNSFVRLSIRIKGRDGIYHRWLPQVGSRALL